MRMSVVVAACLAALACESATQDTDPLASYVPDPVPASACTTAAELPVEGTPPFRLCEVVRSDTLLRFVYDANERVLSFLEVAEGAGTVGFESRTESLTAQHGAPTESCQSDGTITREWAVDSVYLHLSFVPVDGRLEFEASYRPVEQPKPCPYDEAASQTVRDSGLDRDTVPGGTDR